MKLGDINIGTKLLGGFFLVTTLLALVGIVSYFQLNAVMKAADSILEEEVPVAETVMEMKADLLTMMDLSAEFMLEVNPARLAAIEKEFQTAAADFDRKEDAVVKGGTVVRDKDGGDEHGVAPQKDGRRRIEGKVATGLVGSTQPTVGVRRPVRLTLHKSLALEVRNHLVVGVELEHHVVDLSGLTVTDARRPHGLEPVAVHVGAVVEGPACTCIRQ